MSICVYIISVYIYYIYTHTQTHKHTHTHTHTHTHINILCFTGVVDVDAQDIQIEPDKKAQGGLGVLYKGIRPCD